MTDAELLDRAKELLSQPVDKHMWEGCRENRRHWLAAYAEREQRMPFQSRCCSVPEHAALAAENERLLAFVKKCDGPCGCHAAPGHFCDRCKERAELLKEVGE